MEAELVPFMERAGDNDGAFLSLDYDMAALTRAADFARRLKGVAQDV